MNDMLLLFSTYTWKQLRENLLIWEQCLLCMNMTGSPSQGDENISAVLTLPGILKIRWGPMSIATSLICMQYHTVIKPRAEIPVPLTGGTGQLDGYSCLLPNVLIKYDLMRDIKKN